MDTMTPGSYEELKSFVLQFESFLPAETREAIHRTMAQIEASGGIQSEAQGVQILSELMKSLQK